MKGSSAAALAEIHLFGLIAEAHDPDTRDEGDGALGFEAALDASIAVGLVAPEARAEWLERYERYGAATPPDSADVPMDRAFALLDQLARDARESMHAARASGEGSAAAHIRFEDARRALRAIGTLDPAEDRWWARNAGLGDHAELDEFDYEPPARLIGLLGAFPGEPATDAESGMVVSVECYEDGIVVHWRLQRAEPIDFDAPPGEDTGHDLDLTVGDDAGNEYQPLGGGSCSGIQEAYGNSSFAPGVAREARRLRVRWSGGALEVDVAGVADRQPA